MNKLLRQLTDGDLRSDGKANDAARQVIYQPELLPDLVEGFESDSEIIRMRTAHAVEVISRENGNLLEEFRPKLIKYAQKDTLPETRWHLAQVFGNLDLSPKETGIVLPILYKYLESGTVLVKSWTIVGLGNIAKKNDRFRQEILQKIAELQNDKSPAVRNRVVQVLGDLTK